MRNDISIERLMNKREKKCVINSYYIKKNHKLDIMKEISELVAFK